MLLHRKNKAEDVGKWLDKVDLVKNEGSNGGSLENGRKMCSTIFKEVGWVVRGSLRLEVMNSKERRVGVAKGKEVLVV